MLRFLDHAANKALARTFPPINADRKMSNQLKSMTIFYSWQSDLPDETNRNAIRDGLRSVKKALKASLVVSLDEATRDTPGSPNIPAKILEKIRVADVFVADVTTITRGRNKRRPCPNPNVVFELGYAAAHLGWDRIILLVNEDVSPVKDLPFDFDRHRAMTYRLSVEATDADKNKFVESLKAGVWMIAKHDPKRPKDYEGLSIEEVQRQRDIKNVDWAMSQVHIPRLDEFIDEMPNQLNTRTLFFFESFKGVLTSSLFHLNDAVLGKLFQKMLKAWARMLSYDTHYRMTNSVHLQIWDGGQRGDDDTVFKEIQKSGASLRSAKAGILKRVREHYPEIDLEAANKRAWDNYRKAMAEDDE